MRLWATLAVGLVVAAAGVGVDLWARSRREDGDTGPLWERTFKSLVVPALLLLGSLLLVLGPEELWRRGWHLCFDLTTLAGLSYETSFLLALALPVAWWIAAAGVSARSGEPAGGRGLAGCLGPGRSRWWVLALAVPLVAVLVGAWSSLARHASGYPGFGWSLALVTVATLAGVAASGSRGRTTSELRMEEVVASSPLPAWPPAIREQGVDLRDTWTWPESLPARAPRGEMADDVLDELARAGTRDVAPELIEALAQVLSAPPPGDGFGPLRVVLAPDGCGQEEVVAAGSRLLDQRHHGVTLVVTSDAADELAARVAPWLPPERGAQVFAGGALQPSPRPLWFVDAETLSHQLLPILADEHRPWLDRLRLVVWWRLDRFSGVRAANVWAISRRLHRLLRLRGRHDVCTLALLRSQPSADAQVGRFVATILPHRYDDENQVAVERRFARRVSVHRIHGVEEAVKRHRAADHPLLATLHASSATGWPTAVELSRDLATGDLVAARARPSRDGVVGDRVVPTAAEAGARLLAADAVDALSVEELVCQGGRLSPAGLPHHVAFPPADDPYVEHLLRRHAARREAPPATSRRLVCAEAQARVFDRHLRLALEEHPGTRTELLGSFLHRPEILDRTLERLGGKEQLQWRPVRRLDEARGEVERDRRYVSKQVRSDRALPLSVVGDEGLVVLRDPTASDDGVRLVVDPERVTIDAYPGRVFRRAGRRFRVEDWHDVDGVLRRREISCLPEDRRMWTLRQRDGWVQDVTVTDAFRELGSRAHRLRRAAVDLDYREELRGRVEIERLEGATKEQNFGFEPTLHSPRLRTRGLLLELTEEEDPVGVESVARALRHVLPVHLGIEREALAVVPIDPASSPGGAAIFGVVLVDLYPASVGTVDAIADDHEYLVRLLRWTREWLEAEPDDRCLETPGALAATLAERPATRESAVALLRSLT